MGYFSVKMASTCLSMLSLPQGKKKHRDANKNLRELTKIANNVASSCVVLVVFQWGGLHPEKNGWGRAARFPKTLTLLNAKICDISYLIYDLIKHRIPHLVPDPSIDTLF